MLQDISDDKCSFTSEKGSGLRGLPWKDFSKYGLNVGKSDSSRSRIPGESIRKSKQISKGLNSSVAMGEEDPHED